MVVFILVVPNVINLYERVSQILVEDLPSCGMVPSCQKWAHELLEVTGAHLVVSPTLQVCQVLSTNIPSKHQPVDDYLPCIKV